MKKLVLPLVLLSGLLAAYFLFFRKSREGDNIFHVPDPTAIGRIELETIIKGQSAKTLTLKRQTDNSWQVNDRYTALQPKVENFLTYLGALRVYQPIADKGQETSLGLLKRNHTRVLIEDRDGKELIHYLVGPPDSPQKSNIMMREDADRATRAMSPSCTASMKTIGGSASSGTWRPTSSPRSASNTRTPRPASPSAGRRSARPGSSAPDSPPTRRPTPTPRNSRARSLPRALPTSPTPASSTPCSVANPTSAFITASWTSSMAASCSLSARKTSTTCLAIWRAAKRPTPSSTTSSIPSCPHAPISCPRAVDRLHDIPCRESALFFEACYSLKTIFYLPWGSYCLILHQRAKS
jgi:hypothetical protein